MHTGPAWVGSVGEGPRTEMTVLGDTVNVAARLASAALDATLDRRELELRGREGRTEVVSLRVGASQA